MELVRRDGSARLTWMTYQDYFSRTTNNALSSKAVALASSLFRAFCCGGKDPQTLAKRNYQETPNTLLLGMVIKNYKL